MTAYMGWYVLAGATYYVLSYAFVGRHHSNPRTNLWAEFVEGITGDKPLLDKFLSGVLSPCAALALFLAIWPWLIWVETAGKRSSRKSDLWPAKAKPFEVSDDFLVGELPLAEIELLETVEDPMGAAPQVPFGHLNTAWEAFKANHLESGAIWKFTGKHVDDWDMAWLREGYAILKGDGTRPYFLTNSEYLGEANIR